VNERGEAMKMVECEYTSDPEAMMRWIYRAAFWIARKPAYPDSTHTADAQDYD